MTFGELRDLILTVVEHSPWNEGSGIVSSFVSASGNIEEFLGYLSRHGEMHFDSLKANPNLKNVELFYKIPREMKEVLIADRNELPLYLNNSSDLIIAVVSRIIKEGPIV